MFIKFTTTYKFISKVTEDSDRLLTSFTRRNKPQNSVQTELHTPSRLQKNPFNNTPQQFLIRPSHAELLGKDLSIFTFKFLLNSTRYIFYFFKFLIFQMPQCNKKSLVFFLFIKLKSKNLFEENQTLYNF